MRGRAVLGQFDYGRSRDPTTTAGDDDDGIRRHDFAPPRRLASVETKV